MSQDANTTINESSRSHFGRARRYPSPRQRMHSAAVCASCTCATLQKRCGALRKRYAAITERCRALRNITERCWTLRNDTEALRKRYAAITERCRALRNITERCGTLLNDTEALRKRYGVHVAQQHESQQPSQSQCHVPPLLTVIDPVQGTFNHGLLKHVGGESDRDPITSRFSERANPTQMHRYLRRIE